MSVDTNAVHAVGEAEASAEPPETGDSQYPPAPWRLRGWAVQSLHLVDIVAVRPILPPGLRIMPVAPGRTLGCTYVAGYGPGSVLEYHELIVLPALTWRAGRIGFWVSHIYVDHPASAAGGRAVWNLPKELAEFSVEEGGVAGASRSRRAAGVSWGSNPGALAAAFPSGSRCRPSARSTARPASSPAGHAAALAWPVCGSSPRWTVPSRAWAWGARSSGCRSRASTCLPRHRSRRSEAARPVDFHHLHSRSGPPPEPGR